MKTQNASHRTPDRTGPTFVVTCSKTSGARSASVHLLDSSTRPGRHGRFVQSTQTPPLSQNQMANFLIEVEGLPVVTRFLVKELLAEMQSSFLSKGADIHALLSGTLENMA